MRRAVKLLGLLLVGLLLAVAVLVVLVGRDGALSLILGPAESEPISFETLVPATSPNRYLACPPDYCAAQADLDSPLFDVASTVLRERWMKVIAAQPRVTEVAANASDSQLEFIQRSKILAFPDRITVRFIPRGEASSTLAIYSRSHYGYDDFGVNQRRVEAWLAALESIGSP